MKVFESLSGGKHFKGKKTSILHINITKPFFVTLSERSSSHKPYINWVNISL